MIYRWEGVPTVGLAECHRCGSKLGIVRRAVPKRTIVVDVDGEWLIPNEYKEAQR